MTPLRAPVCFPLSVIGFVSAAFCCGLGGYNPFHQGPEETMLRSEPAPPTDPLRFVDVMGQFSGERAGLLYGLKSSKDGGPTSL